MSNFYNAKTTADRIKCLAKEKKITISHLNSICELSENTIRQSGKSTEGMKAKNLYMIAETLDCSVDYLLGRTEEPKLEKATGTHIEQNNNHSLQFVQGDNFPVVIYPEKKILDEMQKELLSRFVELPFTEKLEVMQDIVKRGKGKIEND